MSTTNNQPIAPEIITGKIIEGEPLPDGMREEVWHADAGWAEADRLRAALIEVEDMARNQNTTRQQLRDRLQAILANSTTAP